jgi:hypothetical protein
MRPPVTRLVVATICAFVVASARQTCEAFLAKNLGDGHGAVGQAIARQGAADIVDGKVLFA